MKIFIDGVEIETELSGRIKEFIDENNLFGPMEHQSQKAVKDFIENAKKSRRVLTDSANEE